MMVAPLLSEMKIDAGCTRRKKKNEFSGYISLSSHREKRTREEVTAGSLRSEEEGKGCIYERKRRLFAQSCSGHTWIWLQDKRNSTGWSKLLTGRTKEEDWFC